MKKIGIFGGSFDPVHLGHLGLARDAMQEIGLEKVVLVPAGRQPFKQGKIIASSRDRLAMLHLAVSEYDGLAISDFELESFGISYTYVTMRHMQKCYGSGVQLYFITGTDAFLKIEQWKNSYELLQRYSYIIGSRPGYKRDELDRCIKKLKRDYGTEITVIHNTEMNISSTKIRSKLKKGESSLKLISQGVEQYIREHELYRTNDDH